MTLGQKLDSLNEEVQNYKIMSARFEEVYRLSEKLHEILDLMNIDDADKYYFRKYIEAYSIDEINACIVWCEESARTKENIPYKKFMKIKEKVKLAITLFKEVCEWYNLSILAKEII